MKLWSFRGPAQLVPDLGIFSVHLRSEITCVHALARMHTYSNLINECEGISQATLQGVGGHINTCDSCPAPVSSAHASTREVLNEHETEEMHPGQASRAEDRS